MSVTDVDYGVPMPPRWANLMKYPWLTMKPGGSFKWPGTIGSARVACRNRLRRHGERYRVAKITEDGKHLVRIWRVA